MFGIELGESDQSGTAEGGLGENIRTLCVFLVNRTFSYIEPGVLPAIRSGKILLDGLMDLVGGA